MNHICPVCKRPVSETGLVRKYNGYGLMCRDCKIRLENKENEVVKIVEKISCR